MRNFAGNKKSVNFAVQNISPGGYQSGQMGQTVNLLAYAYGGSNPSPPTQIKTAIYNYRAFARTPLVFSTLRVSKKVNEVDKVKRVKRIP